MLLRPLRWDYFYDEVGKSLVNLTWKLVQLCKSCEDFRAESIISTMIYDCHLSRGLLLFERESNAAISLIAVNFTAIEQRVPFTFKHGGNYYTEQLHDQDNFVIGGRTGAMTGSPIPTDVFGVAFKRYLCGLLWHANACHWCRKRSR